MNDRPETGVIRFGKDWEAVIIRGDQSMGYVSSLKRLFAALPKKKILTFDRKIVEDLIGLLESSNIHSKLHCKEYVQKCKPWKDCTSEESD